jgi:hypothetical protein
MLLLVKSISRQKQLAFCFLAVFALSLCFPVVASLLNTKNQVFPLVGVWDVGLALVGLVLSIQLSRQAKKPASPQLLQRVELLLGYWNTLPLLLLVLFFFEVPINWEILLVGLAWRFWLMGITLPHLVRVLYGVESEIV